MASYLNPSSTASAGTAIGKDPDARGGLRERARIVGGVHRLLSGGVAQDYTGTLRRWQLRWTGLTNAQWAVIKSYIQGGYQLYWQGPEMSAKVAVILEDAEQDQVHLNGDSAAAPHWNVSLTLREGTLANAVQYVYGAAAITLGAVTLSSAGTFTAPVYILDQFTDTNGTSLSAHSIAPTNTPATAWTIDNGTPTIQSNKANFPNNAAAHCNPGVADCTVSANATTPSAGNINVNLLVRTTNVSNCWAFAMSSASSQFQLWEQNAGAWTMRASAAKSFANSATYAMSGVLSGTSISGTVDGGSAVSYTSSLFQSVTGHGIKNASSNACQFDDFMVSP